MVTIDVAQVALWTLAVIGGLWLLPKLVGVVINLAAGIWFILHGDG